MSKIPSTGTSKRVEYPPQKDGAYPARFVKFIGLGIQDQGEYQGKKKSPAFKCSIALELVGKKVVGVKADGTKTEALPSCIFADFALFPGAERGKGFELAKALDPSIEKVPDSLDWFISKLGAPVIATIGHYETRDKKVRNKLATVGQPIEGLPVPEAECELIGFDPYVEDTETYAKLYKFQREELAKAHDAKSIPLAGAEVSLPTEAIEASNTESSDDDQPF